MFSRLCLVPQSGQIIVTLSVLESAGVPRYSLPQIGQVLAVFSEFFISHTPFAQIKCMPQILQMESEITVALNAGSDIGTARNAKWSFFVHDVHKSLDFSAVYGDFHFSFVVESRAALR